MQIGTETGNPNGSTKKYKSPKQKMQRAKVSYNLKTFFWHSAFKRVEIWRRSCRGERGGDSNLALGQHFFNFRPCFGSPGSQFVFF